MKSILVLIPSAAMGTPVPPG